jgi:hypothetical protein
MGLLADLRRHQIRASRLVAALAAVAWFGIAVAPCQASTDAGHVGSSHHGSMPADKCGHCPDTTSGSDAPCAIAAAGQCLSQGQAIVVDDPLPQAAPPPALLDLDPFAPDIGFSTGARIRPAPVARASVQQRFCTYLK